MLAIPLCALSTLVPASPALLRAPLRSLTPRMSLSASTSQGIEQQPLFSFSGDARDASLEEWERIDDVIMGGISSSRLVAAPGNADIFFEGILREQGGGFCGQRMKLLRTPLDLSSTGGLYIRCKAEDDDYAKRVWKVRHAYTHSVDQLNQTPNRHTGHVT